MTGKQIRWLITAFAVLGVALLQGPSTVAGEEGKYEYVGHNKCKKCHIKEYKSWEEIKMADALDSLKPGNDVEIKKKHGLDPDKDYSTDPKCLKCHTTGYGEPGGYAVPDPDDRKSVRHAKYTAGVGCESCHGPGSAYLAVFEEIFKSKRKYKLEELYAVGLTKMEAGVCTTCHNEESPTYEEPFDYETMKAKEDQMHENLPLEQREE